MANEKEAPIGEEGSPSPEVPFDFAKHGQLAVSAYTEVCELYEECAQAVRSVLNVALRVEHIRVHVIDARGKAVESFRGKAERRAEDDVNKPKYVDPLEEIKDLAGVRITVFLSDHVQDVSNLVEREFKVQDREEVQQDSGYRGLHLLVAFKDDRDKLTEYRRYEARTIEIQIRTVLQHAWAEIEHGIGYKPPAPISRAVKAQLRDLAGALGAADRGLQGAVSQAQQEWPAG